MTEYLNGKELPLTELQLADCVEVLALTLIVAR
jgi:hypothetical protein